MKTFVLRVELDPTSSVVGVVERVRTGEKERFRGYDMLVEIVHRMLSADAQEARP
jgi:hypothetical protein